jgi:hypothetical protein
MPSFLIVYVEGLLLSMYNKVMNSDLSEQVFTNKKLAGWVAAPHRRLVLQVSEIEVPNTTLCS